MVNNFLFFQNPKNLLVILRSSETFFGYYVASNVKACFNCFLEGMLCSLDIPEAS